MNKKQLHNEIGNAIANFETSVCLCKDYAMSNKDFVKYKKKYNDNLEIAVRKIKVLIYNAFGELI